MPAIMGLSPYKTPLDAYLQLTGQAPEEKPDPAREKRYRRGKRMEPYITQMMAEDYDIQIIRQNARYTHPDYPFIATEIDFEWCDLADPRTRNGEIKTVSYLQAQQWGEEGTDEIPVHIAAQGMLGLAVTGREVCQYGVLFGMDNLVLYALERDEETIAVMLAEAVRFWNEHVLARVPPPPRTKEDLAKLWPVDRGTSIEATPEIVEALRRHKELGQTMKTCKDERDELDFIIALFCKDNADIINWNGKPLSTYKAQQRRDVDAKRLKAELPQIYAGYERCTTFRVLRHQTIKDENA